MYSWNFKDENKNSSYSTSPSSVGRGSPEEDSSDSEYESSQDPNLRRGRPRADAITTLIFKGAASMSHIRCNTCNRVFPREKSLQAHMRTHTGERPYPCDYPGCGKAFCQSGQLKTHQRLHTGDKPFMCSAEGCESLFTHANRHCQDHPYASLQRIKPQATLNSLRKLVQQEPNPAVQEWLSRQLVVREERVYSRSRPTKRVRRSNCDKDSIVDNHVGSPSEVDETSIDAVMEDTPVHSYTNNISETNSMNNHQVTVKMEPKSSPPSTEGHLVNGMNQHQYNGQSQELANTHYNGQQPSTMNQHYNGHSAIVKQEYSGHSADVKQEYSGHSANVKQEYSGHSSSMNGQYSCHSTDISSRYNNQTGGINHYNSQTSDTRYNRPVPDMRSHYNGGHVSDANYHYNNQSMDTRLPPFQNNNVVYRVSEIDNQCDIRTSDYTELQPIPFTACSQMQPVDPHYNYSHVMDIYQMEYIDYPKQKETHEMTLSEQTDKWISALALIELSHDS